MKHVKNPSAWNNVIASLIAAGIDGRLAVGIVDILVENARQNSDGHRVPLILSKGQMLDAAEKPSKVMEDVDQVMPRLFLVMQQLLATSTLERKHDAHQYCRHAVLIEGKSRRNA